MKYLKKLVITLGVVVVIGLIFQYSKQDSTKPAYQDQRIVEPERPEKVQNYQAEVKKALSTAKMRMSPEPTLEKVDALVAGLQLTLESFVIDSADQQTHLELMLALSQIKQATEDSNLDSSLELLNALFSNYLD